MKKIVLVIALAAILATGTVFADHPGGLGIGIVGFYPGGVGLSLKIPSVPIYWGISAAFGSDYFGADVSGDYYIVDSKLVPAIGLNGFIGLGAFFSFHDYSREDWTDYSRTFTAFGGRIPIGLSWQPVKLLEIFFDVAPSLGLYIWSDEKHTVLGQEVITKEGSKGFHFGWPIELGLRLWF